MRKLLVLAASVFLLSAGAAFAQDDIVIEADPDVDYDTSSYVGLSLGYPSAVHYGLEDVISEGADVRIQLASYFYNFSIGADALFDLTQIEDAIQIYGGGGIALGSTFLGGFNATPSVLAGGEYRFNEQLGVFLEVGAGYTIGYFYPFATRSNIGVNYHF